MRNQYFQNGQIADFYRNSVSIEFYDLLTDRYLAGVESARISPSLQYDQSYVAPSRRVMVDGVERTCRWNTATVGGNEILYYCSVLVPFNEDGMDAVVVFEAYLPPNHVIQSTQLTVVFDRGKCLSSTFWSAITSLTKKYDKISFYWFVPVCA